MITDAEIADLQTVATRECDHETVRLCQIALTQHDGDRWVTDIERARARRHLADSIEPV
jgi:hypothetical protein